MAIRKKKKDEVQMDTAAVVQTANKTHPFYRLGGYLPEKSGDMELYRALREAVPIIDAAIFKIIRLLGSFEIKTENKLATKQLASFLENVDVGGTRCGIDAFISTFFEQLLTYGTAVGEMIVTDGKFSHLFNADLKSVSLSQGDTPLDIIVSADNGMGEFIPVKSPSLILKCVHNPEPGKIYGTSILKGLPFVSNILLKIYNTIGINWERVGNVRFAVTYKPQNDALDKAYAKDRAMQVASEWSKAMSENGPVKDFVAVGDVEIKAIGADNQILDSEIPVKQMLEQIIAKLGIPPFLLGLSWSSTERMSYQQVDILTSEIDAYRRELTPVIRQICSFWLKLNGYDCDFEIEWDDITLQDISELAKSEYYEAQTQKIISEMQEKTD
ncbi:MAG: phage portal protein [Faecalibacterium sp.]|nr:phage portal protein [Ruminococcus sp.]MCM1392676.1 phage portal protein [Ruminococcus sp.]MCM1486344.1 phage portal protein [Faecalibacterium sp.]